MIAPPIPPEEGARLEALRHLRILDTASEARFDRITRVAARLFRVPIALISLVDAERQWFKARHGLEVCETSRDISFCGHAILAATPLIVPDAAKDPRFSDNPLVLGSPGIRFYAGTPLTSPSGHRLGTLCLIDRIPRAFEGEDLAILQDLGAWAERELAAGAHGGIDAEHRYETVVSGLAEGVILQDDAGAILASNESARRILGLTEDQLQDRTSLDPRWAACRPDGSPFPGEAHPSMVALRTGQPLDDVPMGVRLPNGSLRWITINARPLVRPGEARPYAVVTSFTDTTERHRAEAALRDVEARYNGLYHHAGDPIFWVEIDETGTFRYGNSNEAHERGTGYSEATLLGQRPEDVLPPAAAAQVSANYRRCLHEGQAIRYEEELDLPTGCRTWETILVPVPDAQGRISRLVGISRDLTERKQIQHALDAYSAFQRTLLDAAGSSIIATDPEGVILTMNSAAQRLLGWTGEELVGKHTSALFHDPEEVTRRAEELSRDLGRPIPPGIEAFVALARLGGSETREWTYIRKDGSRIPVSLTVSAIHVEGELKGFMGIATDISALRAAEGELRLMAEVARRMDNGVILTDTEGRVTWVNEGFTRISGYTLDEVRGRRPGSILQGPGTSPEEVQRIRMALLGHTGFSAVLLNYRKSGEPYWVEISTQPLRDAQGRLTGFMGLQRDITEARRAEAALRESEARSRALLDALPDRVYRLHRNGTVLDASIPAENPGILAREQVLGKRLQDFLPPELAAQTHAKALGALEEGGMAIFEYRLDAGASIRDFEARCVPIGAEEVVAVVRDITARKASERMKDEFISTVSHELRTPLTAIKGSLGLLAGGATGLLQTSQLDMVNLAHRNVERLARLVNDLLDLQKMDSGRLTFDWRIHALDNLASVALQAMAPLAAEHHVRLRMEEVSAPLFARVDADRFQQILANLLSNAIKFSPEGSEVHLAFRSDETWIRVEVRDQGPGIPESFRPRVFEKFAQADSGTMRAQGGTGLGLSIVKTLAEHMGGQVGFVSEQSRTVFHVDLPRCEAEDAP